jgi:single-strand DNA-binding protein
MNTVTITGNLTREPEIRCTREGQATTQLGVAVNRRWQDRTTTEWQESTSFFDIVCWRDLAENVASLTKGMRVIVTGRLEQRSRETAEGEHRSKVELTADEIGPSLSFAAVQGDVHPPVHRTSPWRATALVEDAVDRRRTASSGRCGAPQCCQPAPPSPRQLGSGSGLRFLARCPPLDPVRTGRSIEHLAEQGEALLRSEELAETIRRTTMTAVIAARRWHATHSAYRSGSPDEGTAGILRLTTDQGTVLVPTEVVDRQRLLPSPAGRYPRRSAGLGRRECRPRPAARPAGCWRLGLPLC